MSTNTDPRSHIVLFVAPNEEGPTDWQEAPGTTDRLVAGLEHDGWTVEVHAEHEVSSQIAARHLHVWDPDNEDVAQADASPVSWVHLWLSPTWTHDNDACVVCRAVDRAYATAVVLVELESHREGPS